MDEHHRKLIEAANEGCLLRRLPAELRNKVYHLVLPTNTVIDTRGEKAYREPVGDSDCWRVDANDDMSYTSYRQRDGITQTCRALRDETLSIYYGTNRFVLHIGSGGRNKTSWHLGEAKYWIRSRPQLAMAALQKIVLSVPRASTFFDRKRDHEPQNSDYCNSLIQVEVAKAGAKWQYHSKTCGDCLKVKVSREDCSRYFRGAQGTKATRLIRFISALKADNGV